MAVTIDADLQTFLANLEGKIDGARVAAASDHPQDVDAEFPYWIAALQLVEDERRRLRASGWYRHPDLVEYRLTLAMSEVQLRKLTEEYLGLGEQVDWAGARQSVERVISAGHKLVATRGRIGS